jgi:hypothetical protein
MRRALYLLVAFGCGDNHPATPDAAAGDAPADVAVDAPPIEPLTGFEIRISESHVGANGHTRREVLVVGFGPDGTPLSDDLVIALDRASAGTLGVDHLTLGPIGATTTFTPCDQASPDCLGPATLSVARAADPQTVLAHVDLQLVPSVAVSTAEPCSEGGNVFYLDGADSLVYDQYRIDNARWYLPNAPIDWLDLYATPLDPRQGGEFLLEFWTDYGQVIPFTVGTFTNLHAPSSAISGPTMYPNYNGGACSDFTGAYQVHDVTVDNTQRVTSMTLSFEKRCDGGDARLLEGCFHYAM